MENTLQIIPLVMIVVGIVKDYVPAKWLKLIAVFVAVGLAIAFDQDITSVINGVLVGVGAIGTYELSKGSKPQNIPVDNQGDFLK